MKTSMILLALAFVLAACGQEPAAVDEAVVEATPHEPEVSIYAVSVANPERLDGDYARDAGRKPEQVLELFGFGQGMTVLDMFSGGGYYSELISHVVGPQGTVVAHSNKAYLNFVGEEFTARHADGRLVNVDVLMAENNELSLNEGEFDAIMLALSFHDLYYIDPESGWPKIDESKLLAELHKGLKDDGFIAIVDHYAEAGAPEETGTTVHRIDRAIVVATMEAAGFVSDMESDLLRNPDDDPSKGVFTPELRGKTDRFIMRFKKSQ